MPYRTLGSVRFTAQISTSKMGTSGQESYRLMSVKKPCYVRNGDVVFGPDDTVMILMDHPQSVSWAKMFKVAHVAKAGVWKRPIKILDPVAKVWRDNGYENLGWLYLNFESPTDLDFDKLNDTKYKFITGQAVKLDDMVDGKVVKKIVKIYGVKVVECN